MRRGLAAWLRLAPVSQPRSTHHITDNTKNYSFTVFPHNMLLRYHYYYTVSMTRVSKSNCFAGYSTNIKDIFPSSKNVKPNNLIKAQ